MKIKFRSPQFTVEATDNEGRLVYSYSATAVTAEIYLSTLLTALSTLQQKIAGAASAPPSFN